MSLAPVSSPPPDLTALSQAGHALSAGQTAQMTGQASALAEATGQFEAIMVRQFLDEALTPMFEGALPNDGAGSHMIRFWTTDSLATAMSGQNIFGLSSVLQHSLAPHAPATTPAAASTSTPARANAAAAPEPPPLTDPDDALQDG